MARRRATPGLSNLCLPADIDVVGSRESGSAILASMVDLLPVGPVSGSILPFALDLEVSDSGADHERLIRAEKILQDNVSRQNSRGIRRIFRTDFARVERDRYEEWESFLLLAYRSPAVQVWAGEVPGVPYFGAEDAEFAAYNVPSTIRSEVLRRVRAGEFPSAWLPYLDE